MTYSTGSRRKRRCSWLRISCLVIVLLYAACLGFITLFAPMEHSSRLSKDANFLSPVSIMRDRMPFPFANNHQKDQNNDCENADPSFHAYDFSKENGCFIHPVHQRPHCQFKTLQIDLNGVKSIRNGGEQLSESIPTRTMTKNSNISEPIMGQPESYEILSYDPQTFQFASQTSPSMDDDSAEAQMLQSGPPSLHYINDIFRHSYVADSALEACSKSPDVKTLPGTTFLIARESYANLYHSMQIWFNAFFTFYPSQASENNPRETEQAEKNRLIFLDAHPNTPLVQVWEDIFDVEVTFLQRDYHEAQREKDSKRFLCLEHARFIPSGPNAPFSVAGHAKKDFLMHCPSYHMMSIFTNHILKKYNLLATTQIPGRVVVIDRVPYLAHPRSRLGAVERHNADLASVAREEIGHLKERGLDISLEVVTLVNQSMAEQIQSIRTAQVVIGDHGAGLTHLLFLDKKAHVIETSCRKLHFKRLVDWSQHLHLKHHCLQSMLTMSKTDLSAFWRSRIIPLLKEILIE